MLEWLIVEKEMSKRSAKDVLSRCGRVYRMLDIDTLDGGTLKKLQQNDEFKESSMFIKSQLKRAVILCLEFMNSKQYSIIDLFAGVGGLSYGFSKLPQFKISGK